MFTFPPTFSIASEADFEKAWAETSNPFVNSPCPKILTLSFLDANSFAIKTSKEITVSLVFYFMFCYS